MSSGTYARYSFFCSLFESSGLFKVKSSVINSTHWEVRAEFEDYLIKVYSFDPILCAVFKSGVEEYIFSISLEIILNDPNVSSDVKEFILFNLDVFK